MPTLWEILCFTLELLVLNCKIWFYISEALFHCVFPPPKKDVSGKLVLITGAGSGIGRALALEFAKHRARLVVWDIDEAAAEETALLVQEWGTRCNAYKCDVTNKQQVEQVAKHVLANIGDVDILVNNAGVFPCKPILELSEKEIRRTFDVNTMAIFWTTQALLPRMIERGEGHLVTVASMAAKHGAPLCVDYSSSKFGAYGAMEALRAELRQLKVTCVHTSVICPMIVNTNMLAQFKHRITMHDRSFATPPQLKADLRQLRVTGMHTSVICPIMVNTSMFGRIYEAPFVAECALDGVLRNQHYIYIPWDKRAIGILNEALPYKARMAIMEFADVGFHVTSSKAD